MNRQNLIFFLLSILAWASETICSPDCTRLKRVRSKIVMQFEGEALEFPCISPPGTPPVDLGWFARDNGTLQRINSNGGRVSAYPSASKGRHSVVLKFQSLQQSDTNKYYCFDVTGKKKYTDAFVRLNLTIYVMDKPVSSTAMNSPNSGENQFEQKDKKKGESLGTSNIPTPSPEAAYVQCWVVHSNGSRQVIDSNDVTVFKTNNGRSSVVLDVRNQQLEGPKEYHCVDNRGERYVPGRLELEILPKDLPAILPTTPEDLEAKESHFIEPQKKGKFSCSSPAAVNLECWKSNDQNGPKQQIKSDGTRVFVLPEEKDGNRSLVLKIQNLQHEDGSTYFCFDNRGDKYELENGPINLSIVNTNESDPVELKTEKSNSVELEIPRMEPPAPAYLSLQIERLSPVEGDMAKLVCTLNLTMGPLKNLLWIRYTDAGTSEVIVPTSSDFSRFSIESTGSETKYEEILTIKDLQVSDARNYGCYVPDRSLDALIPYTYIWLDVTPKP